MADTATPQNVLDLVASTAAEINDEAATLVESCRHSFSGPALPDLAWLQDAELAAVLTHVRSQWGNRAAPVTADTVAAVRKETAARTEPFKGDAELMPLK